MNLHQRITARAERRSFNDNYITPNTKETRNERGQFRQMDKFLKQLINKK